MTTDSPMAFIERIGIAPVGGGLEQTGYWTWCGSVIHGDDGRWHMFASRWSRQVPFYRGYPYYSHVVRAAAEQPGGPYRVEEVVLPTHDRTAWDGRMTHNPTVYRCGDTFLLFYIGATFDGPAPTPEQLNANPEAFAPSRFPTYTPYRIGLATAPSVLGPWRRADRPILEGRPGRWDNPIITNPAPCVREDGSVLLVYRSNTPQGLRLGAARADHWAGPYQRVSDEPVFEVEQGWVEDPYIWWTGSRYEALAKDLTGEITGEKGAGIHAASPDGRRFELLNPPKAYSRTIRWSDGSTTVQGALERAQLLLQDGEPTWLFAATGDGPGGFEGFTRTWNIAIPLRRAGEQ